MLHGLKSALGWTASSPLKPNQLFLLGDTSEADGSILIPELCAYYVQDMSCPVLMISFRETLDSVLGLYRRLGLDLNMLGARDAFFFIDGSTTIDDLDTVQKQATDFMDKHPSKRCLIIVDEVSILPSLGISLDKIFTFLSFLESINPNGDLAVYVHRDCNPEGHLWRWLGYRATQLLLVQPLSTGLSREFHGQLSVHPGGRSYLAPLLPSLPFLFRASESSLFLVPKGSQAA